MAEEIDDIDLSPDGGRGNETAGGRADPGDIDSLIAEFEAAIKPPPTPPEKLNRSNSGDEPAAPKTPAAEKTERPAPAEESSAVAAVREHQAHQLSRTA